MENPKVFLKAGELLGWMRRYAKQGSLRVSEDGCVFTFHWEIGLRGTWQMTYRITPQDLEKLDAEKAGKLIVEEWKKEAEL